MKQIMKRDTVISRNPEQLFSSIDDEIVMLNVPNGEYYNLNKMGSYIWNMIETPLSIRKLVSGLCDNFEVEEEQCMNETKDFIQGLIDKNVILIVYE